MENVEQAISLVQNNTNQQERPKWFKTLSILLKAALIINWISVSFFISIGTGLIQAGNGNYKGTASVLYFVAGFALIVLVVCWFISSSLEKYFLFKRSVAILLIPFLYLPFAIIIWGFLDSLKNFN